MLFGIRPPRPGRAVCDFPSDILGVSQGQEHRRGLRVNQVSQTKGVFSNQEHGGLALLPAL